MAKGQKRRTGGGGRPLQWGASARRSNDRRLSLIALGIACLALLLAGLWWWQAGAQERSFSALAREGAAALERVVEHPDRGRRHIAAGAPFDYGTAFPTSGPHDPRWTETGFYQTPQPLTQIVHALEHGNIVIHYERPGGAVLERLRDWVRLYDGMWDGLVVVPTAGLGEGVVLTAWTRELRLEPFDAAAAAAFIDAYRGRGPENPVR